MNGELQKRDFELRSLMNERDRLNQDLQRLSGMKDRINETAILEEKINGYKGEINNLREKIIHLERTLLDKDTEIASLRREVQTGGPSNTYMSEKDMQSGQKLIYQTQLLELKQENSSLNSKILILKQENENLSRLAKERLLELENIKAEELTRLRKQFEAYVRQHYDIQELTARHEIELRKYQNKVSELLQTITQLQEKNNDLRQQMAQRNMYTETLEKNNEERTKAETMMVKQIEGLRKERDELALQLNRQIWIIILEIDG